MPDDWQDDLITHDFRGHRVCRFKLSEDGSGYSSREMPELIKTSHVAFRPIDVKMGPDGAIYIADWYNPIIQHGEVDFRDPRRDHTHGRIWRVTYKGKPALKRPKLVDASTEELIEALKVPEMWTRQMAKRVLKERDHDEVDAALTLAIAAETSRSPLPNEFWLNLLQTYQTIDKPRQRLAEALAEAKDHRMRAAAVRVLAGWPELANWSLRQYSPQEAMLKDSHPRVRLEGVHGLRGKITDKNIDQVLRVLDSPMDENLDFSLWALLTNHRADWESAVISKPEMITTVRSLLYLTKIVESSELASKLVGRFQDKKLEFDDRVLLSQAIGQAGTPDDIGNWTRALLPLINVAPKEGVGAMRILLDATMQRKLRPAGDLNSLTALLASPHEDVSGIAATAVGVWRVEAGRDRLQEVAKSEITKATVRLAAIDGVAALGGPGTMETLRAIANGQFETSARVHAAAALVKVDMGLAASTTAKLLASADAQLDPSHVITAFIEQKDAAPALIKALKDAKLPTDVAKRAVRVANSSAKPNAELVAALRTAGGISADAWKLSPEQTRQLVQEIATKGDAARGEAIYRRKDTACLKCHAIGGAGDKSGPTFRASAVVPSSIISSSRSSNRARRSKRTTTRWSCKPTTARC